MKNKSQSVFTLLLILVVLITSHLLLTDGCPSSCRCQDNPVDSVLFVACEGTVTGDMLKEIASEMPKNTTALGIEHFDNSFFLTQHFPTLPNLLLFSIQSGAMREVPLNMGEKFPGLQSLYISKTEISKLLPESFIGLINLTSVNLNSNYIEAIKSGAFKHTKNLSTLILHSNRIRKISSRALHGLTKLSTINLQGNDIKYVKPGTFNLTQSPTETVTISEINLEGNRIKKLPNGLFSGVRAIKTLNLQNNFISIIEDKVFHNVNMIFEIELSKNFLKGFPTSSLSWCKKINKSDKNLRTNLISLNLLENPIHCDCSLINLLSNLRKTNRDSNVEAVCKSPRRFYNQPFLLKFFTANFQRCLFPSPVGR